jgi:hypothetical protein
VDIAEAERRSGWRTIRKVVPYLWPDDKPWVKRRVVLALIFLAAAKAVTIGTPFLYKAAVDALAGEARADPGWLMAMGAVGITVAYGVARAASVGFNQLRDAVFARVAQRALRQLALETFQHIHALSLRYHITRKTGGLSRIIERGVKGVEFLLRFLLFSVGPLILELAPDRHRARLGLRHHLPARAGRHHRALYLVHLRRDRDAGEDPARDERAGHRRQPEGRRQPAELRDGEVFRRRTREADRYDSAMAGLRGRRDQDQRLARLPQFRPVADHHHGACDRHGDGRDGGE